MGIEKVLSGIFIPSGSRWGTIGLGILVIIMASIALAYPVGTTVALFIFLGLALLFEGIAMIIHGFGDKTQRGWSRGFSIGVGVLAIIVAGLMIVSPIFGASLSWFNHRNCSINNRHTTDCAGIGGRETRLSPPG